MNFLNNFVSFLTFKFEMSNWKLKNEKFKTLTRVWNYLDRFCTVHNSSWILLVWIDSFQSESSRFGLNRFVSVHFRSELIHFSSFQSESIHFCSFQSALVDLGSVTQCSEPSKQFRSVQNRTKGWHWRNLQTFEYQIPSSSFIKRFCVASSSKLFLNQLQHLLQSIFHKQKRLKSKQHQMKR